MAMADHNIIELEQALGDLLAGVSDQEVAEHAPRLRRLLDMTAPSGSYGEISGSSTKFHILSPNPPTGSSASLQLEWIDRALCDGKLPACLLLPPTGAEPLPLLPSQWRVYSPEQRHLVIAGAIRGSVGDEPSVALQWMAHRV